MGVYSVKGLNAVNQQNVRFQGTVTRDAAPHFITFPGHSDVFKHFEKTVHSQLKPDTHLDLTSSTYSTSAGRRQEHFVTVSRQKKVLADKTYIGAWGADEHRQSPWDFLAWIPGTIGRWATNKKDQAWYKAQLDRALQIALSCEKNR